MESEDMRNYECEYCQGKRIYCFFRPWVMPVIGDTGKTYHFETRTILVEDK